MLAIGNESDSALGRYLSHMYYYYCDFKVDFDFSEWE